MTTLGLDFVVIKDHRGFESGFFWSDVHQFLGEYEVDEWVKVKFRNDHEGFYSLRFKMPVREFLAEVKEQLNHPPRLYADGEEFPPPPDPTEFFKPCATTGTVTPMSTMDSSGVPVEQIETS